MCVARIHALAGTTVVELQKRQELAWQLQGSFRRSYSLSLGLDVNFISTNASHLFFDAPNSGRTKNEAGPVSNVERATPATWRRPRAVPMEPESSCANAAATGTATLVRQLHDTA